MWGHLGVLAFPHCNKKIDNLFKDKKAYLVSALNASLVASAAVGPVECCNSLWWRKFHI